MGQTTEVAITNLPLSVGRTVHEDGREELTAGTISIFSGQLQLVPKPERRIGEILRSKSKRGLKTVSATAIIADGLMTELSARSGRAVPLHEVVTDVSVLLSFATRRGVSFKTTPEWWPSEGAPIVRGKCQSQGPAQGREIGLLLERALPILYDPAYRDDLQLSTALRWFLGWDTEQFVEIKFIRLWIVLELLASNYWRGKPVPSQRMAQFTKFHQSFDYLTSFNLPKVSLSERSAPVTQTTSAPLRSMYEARNSIVHGDPVTAKAEMAKWFGMFREERNRKLGLTPDMKDYPDPQEYGSCLFEAADMLSRILEKVFLNLFGCTDFWFYRSAEIHTACMP